MLCFTGDRVAERSCKSLNTAGLTVGTVGDPQITRDLPWRLETWDDKHPIFQEFSDPQHGDLRQWIFAAYTRVAPASDVNVLARFGTGDPAVLEKPIGQGNVLWVTTSCGRDWGNWSRTRLFLPMVHQLVGYQVGLSAGGRVRFRLLDGEGTKTGTPGSGALINRNAGFSTSALGVTPGIARHQRFVEVVNVSPRESETDISSRKDFEDRFGFHFVDSDGRTVTESQLRQDVEFRADEIWHWIACAALCGILLEGFVGNRTTA